MNEKIEELIKSYSRQMELCKERETYYESKKDNLSCNGYWSLGYFTSKASLCEDIIDDLKELLKD